MSKNLVTIKEVAEYLSVSVSTVRNLIKKDEIPHVVVGGIYRFDMDKVRESVGITQPENSVQTCRDIDDFVKSNYEEFDEDIN